MYDFKKNGIICDEFSLGYDIDRFKKWSGYSMSVDAESERIDEHKAYIRAIVEMMIGAIKARKEDYANAGLEIKRINIYKYSGGSSGVEIDLTKSPTVTLMVNTIYAVFEEYIIASMTNKSKKPKFRIYFHNSKINLGYIGKMEFSLIPMTDYSFRQPALFKAIKIVNLTQEENCDKIDNIREQEKPKSKFACGYELKSEVSKKDVRKEEEKKNMKKFNGFKDMFVFEETNRVGVNMLNGGMAIKNNGVAIQFSSIPSEDGAIENLVEVPEDMLMEFPAYVISTQIDQIKAGDIIKYRDMFGFVNEINGNEIIVLNLNGEKITYNIPQNIFFGNMKLVPKVIFPFGNIMGGNNGGNSNGGIFGNMNPMMMMMFMKDGDFGGDDMFKNMMLMQCMSGNGGMGIFGC